MTAASGWRSSTPTLVISFIRGTSQEPKAEVLAAAQALQSVTTRVISIGVDPLTDSDREELLTVADGARNVFDLAALEGAIQQGPDTFLSAFVEPVFISMGANTVLGTVVPTVVPTSSLSLSVSMAASSSSRTSSSLVPTSTPVPLLCDFLRSDVVFVYDGSGSVSTANYEAQLGVIAGAGGQLLDGSTTSR